MASGGNNLATPSHTAPFALQSSYLCLPVSLRQRLDGTIQTGICEDGSPATSATLIALRTETLSVNDSKVSRSKPRKDST